MPVIYERPMKEPEQPVLLERRWGKAKDKMTAHELDMTKEIERLHYGK